MLGIAPLHPTYQLKKYAKKYLRLEFDRRLQK